MENELKKIPIQLKDCKFNRVLFKGKGAFETGWQNNPYTYEEIKKYFPRDNYGVICGEDLRVLDDDTIDKKLIKLFLDNFGETFRVRDHLYFKFDNKHSKKIIFYDKNGEHYGELQGENTYVVGPGSTHPSGEIYEQKNNLPILTISYDRFLKIFEDYIQTNNSNSTENYDTDIEDDKIINYFVPKWVEGNRQNLTLALSGYLRKNKRFGYNHSINIILKICQLAGDNDFNERKAVVQQTYLKDEKEIKGISGLKEMGLDEIDKREMVILPKEGKLISDFASELGYIFEDKEVIFFRPSSMEVVEITYLEENDDEYLGFLNLKPERFITLSEKYLSPCVEKFDKEGKFIGFKTKSMGGNISSIVLSSSQLQNKLPKINRIFHSPIPIIYNNQLTFPDEGYDERFKSFTPINSPKISEMSLDESIAVLNKVFGEFCFQEELDKTNAIAGLLTPFIRGLLPSFSTRTPMFVYTANRERAGKDYCAGITGLVHEGYALEEPPISTGEKGGSSNEELRKKILSALLSGRKRLHFANNKGYINNSVLEGFLTSEQYSDRVLGKNNILNLPNEIDVSLSGNVGIGFTPDLINRARFVRLFLAIEDANLREFSTPNLHEWVRNNRSLILSALYSLVKNWFNMGCPNGSIPFTSFPDWARICGGIMECANLGNPCKTDKETLAVGGDVETMDMKLLFELVYSKYPNQWISKSQIKDIILENEDGLFSYLNLETRSDQIKLGIKISRFVGRYLSDILLKLKDSTVRTSRQEFMFTKIEKTSENLGNDGNVGNVCQSAFYKKKLNNIYSTGQVGGESLPSLPTLPKLSKEEIEQLNYSDEEMKMLKEEGLI